MRIWLFAAKLGLFVRIKFVILLPILMTGSLVMATALCKTIGSALSTIVWVPSLIHCPISPRAAEVHDNVMIHNDIMIRDGHGIPKCSPCPSVFFYTTGSVRPFPCFFWVASTYVRHTDS